MRETRKLIKRTEKKNNTFIHPKTTFQYNLFLLSFLAFDRMLKHNLYI